jgi:hypothetical protein
MDTTWQERLANLSPGNYLLTKLEDGFRVWSVDCAEAYFIDSDFDRLNAKVDADILAALAKTDGDDEPGTKP